jgi:hypothetical protein
MIPDEPIVLTAGVQTDKLISVQGDRRLAVMLISHSATDMPSVRLRQQRENMI